MQAARFNEIKDLSAFDGLNRANIYGGLRNARARSLNEKRQALRLPFLPIKKLFSEGLFDDLKSLAGDRDGFFHVFFGMRGADEPVVVGM